MTFECVVRDCPITGCQCTALHAANLLDYPQGMHTAVDGSYLIADTNNCVVRRFDAPERVGDPSSYTGEVVFGIPGQCASSSLQRADPSAVTLNRPHGVSASDDMRSVYVADTYSHCIRAAHGVGTARPIAEIAAGEWNIPQELKCSSTVAATPSIQRLITASLVFQTGVCGVSGYQDGEASSALFATPHDVTVSRYNNNEHNHNNYMNGTTVVYTGEQYSGAVRQVLEGVDAAEVGAVIGSARLGFSDGNATEALLNYVHDVTELDAGVLLITEYATNRLRRVRVGLDARIDTLAGSGSSELYAQQYRNGPATTALFRCISGSATGDDAVSLVEYQNGRVRQLRLASEPGRNRALVSPAKASSTWSASYTASNAADGDHATYWCSAANTQTATLELALPEAFAADDGSRSAQVTIHWKYAAEQFDLTLLDARDNEVIYQETHNTPADSDFASVSVPMHIAAPHVLVLKMSEPRERYAGQPLIGVFEVDVRASP